MTQTTPQQIAEAERMAVELLIRIGQAHRHVYVSVVSKCLNLPQLIAARDENSSLKSEIVQLDYERNQLRNEAERLRKERDELQKELQRMTDLVRYQRAELHQAELITDDEYARLCSINGSRERLESYDALRTREAALMEVARAAKNETANHCHSEQDGNSACSLCNALSNLAKAGVEVK